MKSIKVRPEDHKWLLIESANRDTPIYKIVKELIECYEQAKKHGFWVTKQ
jgi:hypothetical protein